jgi:hypothetical protein
MASVNEGTTACVVVLMNYACTALQFASDSAGDVESVATDGEQASEHFSERR